MTEGGVDPDSTTNTEQGRPQATDLKAVVRRIVQEVINLGDLDVLTEICTPRMAVEAREWIEPFRVSFPDVHMEIVSLVAEADMVAGRFTCSATNLGPWLGKAATGRQFVDVDEVYFFTFEDERIGAAWGLEDSVARLRQLGMMPDQ